MASAPAQSAVRICRHAVQLQLAQDLLHRPNEQSRRNTHLLVMIILGFIVGCSMVGSLGSESEAGSNCCNQQR